MDEVISWLLEGDASIQYMTHLYLLNTDKAELSRLQRKIETEGFGERFLSCQNENGHWGYYYYQPKWTSTHYTLLDLKCLCAPDTLKPCRDMITRMFNECMDKDGGINLSKNTYPSDIAIDGMILNYASYFYKEEPRIKKLVDYLLPVQKQDGGFTWNLNSEIGDPHTTICVLEGFGQYQISGLQHRLKEIEESKTKAVEFLLSNQLFMNDPDKRFRKLSYPYRYRYDLLRALEYFVMQKVPFDCRMKPAVGWLNGKRKQNGLWHLENRHKGNVHFLMEEVRTPSRFVTLKALCILKHFCFPE
jgi:hypothetical protein